MREAIQARYGVEIDVDAQMQPFSHYAIYPVGVDETARAFLLMLERQLAMYPQGFFKEAKRLNCTFLLQISLDKQ